MGRAWRGSGKVPSPTPLLASKAARYLPVLLPSFGRSFSRRCCVYFPRKRPNMRQVAGLGRVDQQWSQTVKGRGPPLSRTGPEMGICFFGELTSLYGEALALENCRQMCGCSDAAILSLWTGAPLTVRWNL